jgi:intracellular sulfur oxidation DsrE/DsrF family protein
LRFVACSNTLYSFKQRGELVALVDEAEIAPSAVQFVVDHMRNGWRYIAI